MARNIPVEGRLVLSGEITLQSVDAIHSRLLEMAGQPVVEIDCSGVTEADLSLVQLILAARASAQKSGRSVVLAQPATGALRNTLQRGGFIGAAADQSDPGPPDPDPPDPNRPNPGPPDPDRGFWIQPAGAR
jgi:ABC-type transporter Mla MlaB component